MKQRHEWRDPIDITKELWELLLQEEDIITQQDVQLFELIYNCDGYEATASHLARLLNIPHHIRLNNQVGRLGKRIVKRLNISAPRQESGNGFNWWHVPFLGEARKDGYYWILRPELIEAIKDLKAKKNFSSSELKLPEEIDSEKSFYEGAKKQIYVNSYERNKDARDQCIRHYGTQCVICDFDFQKVYGEIGKGVIHVHHLKPLSDIGETYRVDPIEDLRPVCPNCHVIIHKKEPPYSIEEVMTMLDNGTKPY